MPLLLCGPTGTGKTAYVSRYLRGLDKETHEASVIGFSARTSANATQEQVDLRLDKRRRGEYGPPPGKRAIFFVDDLNLQARDAYG